MRGLWLSLCMFTSFPNFALLVFICQFQGFLFGAILVHACHRETTGVLNGSPQCGFGFGLCWVLQGFVRRSFFPILVEMQTLVRSKTLGVTGYGGRGTAGAGPGRDLLWK